MLVNKQFILRSGSVNVRFIHNKYTKPWLIRTYYIPRYIREELGNKNVNTWCALSVGSAGNKVPRLEGGASSDKHVASGEINNVTNEKMDNSDKKFESEPHLEDENQKHDLSQADNDSNRAIIRSKRRKWVTLSKENLNKFGEINVS